VNLKLTIAGRSRRPAILRRLQKGLGVVVGLALTVKSLEIILLEISIFAQRGLLASNFDALVLLECERYARHDSSGFDGFLAASATALSSSSGRVLSRR
jgi:hypothetical protein